MPPAEGPGVDVNDPDADRPAGAAVAPAPPPPPPLPLPLPPAVESLLALAAALDETLAGQTDLRAVQALGRAQQALRSRAAALVAHDIDGLAAAAGVGAAQVDAALAYAGAAIRRTTRMRAQLRRIRALLDFIDVLLVGDGAALLRAARALKSVLDAP
jgi:hypothetical protein